MRDRIAYESVPPQLENAAFIKSYRNSTNVKNLITLVCSLRESKFNFPRGKTIRSLTTKYAKS